MRFLMWIIFEVKADFVKQYRGSDRIIHLKTMFEHNEIKENELWKMFNGSGNSSPLELLLNI